MGIVLVLAALAQLPADPVAVRDTTPNGVVSEVARDLTAHVPPGRRFVTRYVSLQAYPESDRATAHKAFCAAANSVSFKTNPAHPALVADGMLIRIDLEDLGWDKAQRHERITALLKEGVKFGTRQPPEWNLFVDIWERIARDDPYYEADRVLEDPHFRGMTNVAQVRDLAKLTCSVGCVVRADWLLPRLLLEKEFGGYYSDLLLLPDDEKQLYKVLGSDIGLIERNDQTRIGDAVVAGKSSYVALHNRELQHLHTAFGDLWRTFDVADEKDPRKRVLVQKGGTLRLDGREILFALPNGLQGGRLSNAQGQRVADVPPNIAQDKRSSSTAENRVINYWKCASCHWPEGGYIPFKPEIKDRLLAGGQDIAAFKEVERVRYEQQAYTAYDYGRAYTAYRQVKVVEKVLVPDARQARFLADYYTLQSEALSRTLKHQREGFRAAMQEACGLPPGTASELLDGYVENYLYAPVTLPMASADLGIPEFLATLYLLKSGDAEMVNLGLGHPIGRDAYEQGFYKAVNGMPPFYWEYVVQHSKPKSTAKVHP